MNTMYIQLPVGDAVEDIQMTLGQMAFRCLPVLRFQRDCVESMAFWRHAEGLYPDQTKALQNVGATSKPVAL